METNMIVLPSATNILLYRTFPSLNHHKQDKQLDFAYAPLTEVMAQKKAPATLHELQSFMSRLSESEQITPSISSQSATLSAPEIDFLELKEATESHLIPLITRRQAGLLYTYHTNMQLFKSMGLIHDPENLKMIGYAISALAGPAMSLAQHLITNEKSREAVMSKVSKAISAFKSTKGNVAKKLAAAVVSGVSGMATPTITAGIKEVASKTLVSSFEHLYQMALERNSILDARKAIAVYQQLPKGLKKQLPHRITEKIKQWQKMNKAAPQQVKYLSAPKAIKGPPEELPPGEEEPF